MTYDRLTDSELMAVSGNVFDVQRYSLHDGPGIRTIVFLKGCGLRCRWCCNPEGQHADAETLRRGGREETVGSIRTAGDVIDEVMRDLPYYRRSGGGITLSGGECLLQPAFSSALLTLAHRAGIPTAVETAGFVPRENIQAVLPEVDLFLYDIKHTDPTTHRAWCGRDNSLILENSRFVGAHAREMIIRVPVIPGFNDSEDAIRKIARHAASLDCVRRLHLLPYHRLGYDKYTGLGRDYGMGETPIPTDAHMRALLSVAEESGLLCQIGG